MTPALHRLAMCRIAFAGLADVVVDDRELCRGGPSYTVDTLAELGAEHPGEPLFFLIGSDNLPLLPTWHDHHRLLGLCTVVTYPRADHPADATALAGLDLTADERRHLLAHVLPLPAFPTAATTIRERLRRGHRDDDDLAAGVVDYIRTHGLYRA